MWPRYYGTRLYICFIPDSRNSAIRQLVFSRVKSVNVLGLSKTYKRQWTMASLIHVMDCHLLVTKPLPKTVMAYWSVRTKFNAIGINVQHWFDNVVCNMVVISPPKCYFLCSPLLLLLLFLLFLPFLFEFRLLKVFRKAEIVCTNSNKTYNIGQKALFHLGHNNWQT